MDNGYNQLMLPYLHMPKVQMSLYLLLIYGVAIVPSASIRSVYIVLIALTSAIFFDLLFTFLKKRVFFIPHAAVVTALIIALLIDPKAGWFQIAAICALAMAVKHFVRISGRHIFNPAAGGLILGSVLFKLGVAWWGVSAFSLTRLNLRSLLLLIVLLLPLLVSGIRLRRYASILAFIFTYTVAISLLGGRSSIGILLDPTVIFFAIVMLPEPVTSPATMQRQIWYGATVALATVLLSLPAVSALLSPLHPDVLILALLLGNALFFRLR